MQRRCFPLPGIQTSRKNAPPFFFSNSRTRVPRSPRLRVQSPLTWCHSFRLRGWGISSLLPSAHKGPGVGNRIISRSLFATQRFLREITASHARTVLFTDVVELAHPYQAADVIGAEAGRCGGLGQRKGFTLFGTKETLDFSGEQLNDARAINQCADAL